MKQLLLFFLLGCFQWASSQTATVDKQKILLGEQFQLKLEAVFPENRIEWPLLDSLPHFEILDKSKVDTQRNFTGVTLSQSFTLTSFDSGRWQIPPIIMGRARTKPVIVEVVFTSPFDPAQPYHDIKDILEVDRPIESRWYWYLIFALLLIGLFLLFFPKGKKKDAGVFVPDEGAYKTALKKLDQLRSKEVPDAKQFYTELVDIFRTYLQKRKNIQSFSKTTDDLSLQIRELDLPEQQYRGLVQALRLSDMAKYARFQPTSTEKEESAETIRQNIISIEQLPDAVQLAPKY